MPLSNYRRRQPEQIVVFVSSSNEVADHRRFFKSIQEGINKALLENDVLVTVAVEVWEDATPQRVPKGETSNDRFVQMACNAHLTCCILAKNLRPGTKQELEAVMALDDVELAVMVCVDNDDEWPPGDVADIVQRIVDEDRAFVSKVGRLDRPNQIRSKIVQTLLHEVFKAIRGRREPFYERR